MNYVTVRKELFGDGFLKPNYSAHLEYLLPSILSGLASNLSLFSLSASFASLALLFLVVQSLLRTEDLT